MLTSKTEFPDCVNSRWSRLNGWSVCLVSRLWPAFFLASRQAAMWVSELFLFSFLFSSQRFSTVAFKHEQNPSPREKRSLIPNCFPSFQTAYNRSFMVSYILSISWCPDSSSADSLVSQSINKPNKRWYFYSRPTGVESCGPRGDITWCLWALCWGPLLDSPQRAYVVLFACTLYEKGDKQTPWMKPSSVPSSSNCRTLLNLDLWNSQ